MNTPGFYAKENIKNQICEIHRMKLTVAYEEENEETTEQQEYHDTSVVHSAGHGQGNMSLHDG